MGAGSRDAFNYLLIAVSDVAAFKLALLQL